MAWKTSPSIFSFFNDIESVLKNLDISAFNILPSQCNITVDILTTSSSAPSRTALAVGTLSHVRIQAMQLTLIDVSFWYLYNTEALTSLTPNEFASLLGLTLPSNLKGIDIDLKNRLIPSAISEDVNI